MNVFTVGLLGGRGKVGEEVAAYLLKNSNCKVIVGGRNKPQLEREYWERFDYSLVDINNKSQLNEFCKKCNILINCTSPASLNKAKLAMAALNNSIHYVDPDGYNPLYYELLKRENEIKEKK